MWVVVIPPVSVPPGELAELADALDLGSSIERCKGSSPLFPTNRAKGPGLTNTFRVHTIVGRLLRKLREISILPQSKSRSPRLKSYDRVVGNSIST